MRNIIGAGLAILLVVWGLMLQNPSGIDVGATDTQLWEMYGFLFWVFIVALVLWLMYGCLADAFGGTLIAGIH